MRFTTKIALAGVSLLAMPNAAFAQGAPADDAKAAENSKDIVVTGTLIRGTAPGSSQALAITAEDAKATGAATTAQLLATMPQSGFFATLPVVLGNNSYQKSANRPTLRNLDGGNNGSNPTLLLLDGHRLPGMGVLSNSPDLDAIPAGAIQRVDVVPDGGSSIYGADAVGGVINLITRKSADGIDLSARYGFAKNYYTTDVNATVGQTWGGVSAYVSYNFAKHDSLAGRDRDFVRRFDWVNNVLQDTNCTPANIRVGASTFSSATSAAGLGTRCDRSDDQTFYPTESRHSVLGSLNIDNGGPLSINVKAWYTNRKNTGIGQPFAGSINLASNNPFYQAVTALAPATPTETVLFSYGSVLPQTQYAALDTWGITPSIKYNIGGGWQVNALINFGQGTTEVKNQAINTAILGGFATAGTFNPFNVGAASNAAALATLGDFFVYGKSINKLTNGRIVADGPLFTLPGGDVKFAIGGEFSHEQFDLRFTPSAGLTSAAIAASPFPHATRSTQSVFGELSIPLAGGGNGGIKQLLLSLSGRYDHYNDVGGTFNPKIGLVFEPVEGLKLRGNWGKAFQSPGLSDTAVAQPASITDFGALGLGVRFANPAVPTQVGQTQLAIGGGGPALRPQKAQTWSMGFDFKPVSVPGLNVSVTYYNVSFKDRIAIPSIFASDFYTSYPAGFPSAGGFYIQGTAANPLTEAQLVAAGALGGATGPAVIANYVGANYVPGKVNNILFSGKANLATVKTSGIDYAINFTQQTGFGSFFANFSGEYVLKRDEQATAASPAIDRNGIDFPKYRGSFTVGANVGDLLAQATLTHSGSYKVVPLASALNQDTIGAFDSVALFFKYDVKGSGLSKDLSFTLNVDNLFNKAPPLYRGTFSSNSDGYGIGTIIGRLVTIGVSKKF